MTSLSRVSKGYEGYVVRVESVASEGLSEVHYAVVVQVIQQELLFG